MPPDVGQGLGEMGDPSKSPYDFEYGWNDPTPTMLSPSEYHNDYETSYNPVYTPATMVFGAWPDSPRVNHQYKVRLRLSPGPLLVCLRPYRSVSMRADFEKQYFLRKQYQMFEYLLFYLFEQYPHEDDDLKHIFYSIFETFL